MIKVIWENHTKGEIISEEEYNQKQDYFRKKYPSALHVYLYKGENTFTAKQITVF